MKSKLYDFYRLPLLFCLLLFFCSAAFADEYNVQNYGVTGNGTTDDGPALNNLANVYLGSKGGVLYFPNTSTVTGNVTNPNAAATNYLIGSNVTFARNIILKFDVGASLKVSNNITVTSFNPPQADRYKIFNLVGTGKVLFGTQISAFPQWWGAVDDAAGYSTEYPTGTDNTAAFQSALNALNGSGGGTLDVRTKIGFLFTGNTGLSMDGMLNIKMEGNAGRNTYLPGSKNLIFSGAPANAISARSSFHLVFEGVGINHTSHLFTGALLFIGSTGADPAYHIIRDCNFSYRDEQNPTAEAGIKFGNVITSTVEKSGFQGLINGITTKGYANVVTIRENLFVYNKSYGINLTPGAESWQVEQNTFEGGSNDAVGKGLTRALKAVGSVWALSFKDNWLGDGTGGAATDDAMVDVKHVYGLLIENNRFANYGGTRAYGIHIEDCLSPGIKHNRFEYMPTINATADTGYTYELILESNNYNGELPQLGGVLGLAQFDNERSNRINGGFQVRGTFGTDPVGAGTIDLGFGTIYGPVNNAGKYGGGIRMTSAVPGYNDGSMIFSVRPDIVSSFGFWNHNGEQFLIGDTIKSKTDVYVDNPNKGIILKSPDGTCYRFTVANGGNLNTGVSVTCPQY